MRSQPIIKAIWVGAVLLAIWQAALLILHPDPRDALRQADALFDRGRYTEALAAYRALPLRAEVAARIGMLETIRGDYNSAARSFGRAIRQGVSGPEYDLVRLGQGYLAAADGAADEAARFWHMILPGSRFAGPAAVLAGNWRVQIRDYGGAEWFYRSALEQGLPDIWQRAVHLRLALLRASSDPAGAQAELAAREQPVALPEPYALRFVLPLLHDNPRQAVELTAALAERPPQRDRLLGRMYLDADLPDLALGRFVAAGEPVAAAYARWRMGDRQGGLAALAALADARPNDPELPPLLVMMYLSQGQSEQAGLVLAQALADAERPSVLLAQAQWWVAQREYLAAAAAYQHALDQAPAEQRGAYALLQARFQTFAGVQVCSVGRAAAAEATRLLPDDPRAWKSLADVLITCGEALPAIAAAEQSVRLDPADAEAAYHLGRAYILSGDPESARTALMRAADLAPASVWRVRAEQHLQSLP